jgi:transposase-like protein
VDEYEALRLVDLEGLQQQEAAERMKVSRATCARILEEAHRKVADALTTGKAIRIEGGSFVLGSNRYRCRECGTTWDIPLRGAQEPPPAQSCPSCRSDKVMDLGRQVGHGGGRPLEPGEAGGGPMPGDRGQHGGRGWRGGHPGR